MSCMNFTSAGVAGGNVALVEDGSLRVGWPGAPGWTTTGVLGSACCAETDSDNKHTIILAAQSPLRETATLISKSSGMEWLKFTTNAVLLPFVAICVQL